MGIVSVSFENTENGTNANCFLAPCNDTRAFINGLRFSLEYGSYPDANLQKAYNKYGKENCKTEVVQVLEYDKEDELKTDYSDQLQDLLDIILAENPGSIQISTRKRKK